MHINCSNKKLHLNTEPFLNMQSNDNNTNGIVTISDTSQRIPRNAQVVVILAEQGITEIPKEYFQHSHQLKYVQMPDNIHTIGDYAFHDCTNLKSIVLPKRLYSIGERCFEKCLKLKFIKLPNTVHHVQKEAFAGCSKLEYVILSKNMKYLPSMLFSSCAKLKYLDVPSSVKEIKRAAFEKCTSLERISLPDTLTTIPTECFSFCTSLKKFKWKVSPDVQESYITMQNYAFFNCYNLKCVNLSESSVYCLEERSFKNCKNLTTVILSKYTKNIHAEAFQNCSSLQYMNYGDKVDDMDSSNTQYGIDLKHTNHFDNNVFRDCTGIESIKIYEHQYFMENALLGCDNLQRVSLPRYFHLNDCLAIYSHPTNIQEVMIRSKAKDISAEVVDKALLAWIYRNPGLLEKECTEDGLLPIQVLFEVFLLNNHKEWKCENTVVVLYIHFCLTRAPATISLFMPK